MQLDDVVVRFEFLPDRIDHVAHGINRLLYLVRVRLKMERPDTLTAQNRRNVRPGPGRVFRSGSFRVVEKRARKMPAVDRRMFDGYDGEWVGDNQSGGPLSRVKTAALDKTGKPNDIYIYTGIVLA